VQSHGGAVDNHVLTLPRECHAECLIHDKGKWLHLRYLRSVETEEIAEEMEDEYEPAALVRGTG
jgi:hypothetical protein